MRETGWVEWTRTKLEPREREDLLGALTPEQNAHLLEHDYTWVKGVGVLWTPTDGGLRRSRFTHGTCIRTRLGEFSIDSQGRTNGRGGTRAESDKHPDQAIRSPRLRQH